MPISGGRRYLFISNIPAKTEALWKAFAARNNFTLADIATICSHLFVAHSIESLSRSPAGFEAIDQEVRAVLENQPEQWKKIPLLTRLLGHVIRPLYREDVEEIERVIAEGEP